MYAADPDDLWDALTSAERIPKWFLPIEGDLRLGGHYRLEGNASGEITRCDPPKALDVTWEFDGQVSWVSVRAETHPEGAQLTLEHTMLKDPASEDHWRQFGPGATGVGWDLAFFGLALHLQSGGQAVDREASEAWLASVGGKTFIHRCAQSWCAAHIASGEKLEIAREMAARTGAFYAGD